MKFAQVYSAEPFLLDATIVSVETDIARGLHAFSLVGLPDKAVEEAKDRVAAAIKNSGFTSPKSQNQKTTVSLAPADVKKEGSAFDVAIALSYLLASEAIDVETEGRLFLGELALDGSVRTIKGALAVAKSAAHNGFTELYVPKENAAEAALIADIAVYPIESLAQLLEHLATPTIERQPTTKLPTAEPPHATRLDDIRGQEHAKRGLEIAAAGGHNIALSGPPGTGKTMLARALATLVPPLSFEEALEVTAIHSSAGSLTQRACMTAPPFRAPHHTSSYVSLIGGGATPKAGEVTLAHRGVLFCDEFPEFERRVIDALRQPMEEGSVAISRARGSAQFPADFIFIAALNPCPCGNYGTDKACTCTPATLNRYQRKLSGPIVDRIDMWIEVPHVSHDELMKQTSESDHETANAQKRVRAARKRQHARSRGDTLNARIRARDMHKQIGLSDTATETLKQAAATLDLSPRSFHRVQKVARTIADLAGSENTEESHILEALQYRPKALLP